MYFYSIYCQQIPVNVTLGLDLHNSKVCSRKNSCSHRKWDPSVDPRPRCAHSELHRHCLSVKRISFLDFFSSPFQAPATTKAAACFVFFCGKKIGMNWVPSFLLSPQGASHVGDRDTRARVRLETCVVWVPWREWASILLGREARGAPHWGLVETQKQEIEKKY